MVNNKQTIIIEWIKNTKLDLLLFEWCLTAHQQKSFGVRITALSCSMLHVKGVITGIGRQSFS